MTSNIEATKAIAITEERRRVLDEVEKRLEASAWKVQTPCLMSPTYYAAVAVDDVRRILAEMRGGGE